MTQLLNERWTIERFDQRDQEWTSYYRAHGQQWDGARWDVAESHTLDKCLAYVSNHSMEFLIMLKNGYKYRLREEVSGDAYPLDLFL